MARRRLGVVLLLPEPVSAEIDVLRRALGDGALGKVPPHITLVPPVNVREEELDTAIALARAAADGERGPVALDLGPVTTFHPVTPVVYLAVGDGVEAVHRLRAAVFRPPLEREVDFAFVPHVTLAYELAAESIVGAVSALGQYRAHVEVDRVTIMEEGADRVWRPIADAALGPPARATRGGVALEITAHLTASPEAAGHGAQHPLAVEARAGGRVVGFARGRVHGERAWLDEIWVVEPQRGSGIGAEVLRAFAREAEASGAHEIAAVAEAGSHSAGFVERMGFVREATDLYLRRAPS